MGGLGNQLHGLAAGLVLANHLQLHPVIDSERVYFGSNMARRPDIEKILMPNLSSNLIFKNSDISQKLVLYEKVRRKSRFILPNLIKHQDPDYFDSLTDLREQLACVPKHARSVGGLFLDFEWANEAIKFGFPEAMSPKNPSITYLRNLLEVGETSTALHIRIGDYLKLPKLFPIAPEIYYLKALEKLDSIQGIDVFTDSPELLDRKYPRLMRLNNVRVVDPEMELDSVETMALISKYKQLITSNSTFSSWAGWFLPAKKVVTPVPHHLDGWKDSLPSNWIRLNIEDQ
jgi:hypothetical protein